MLVGPTGGGKTTVRRILEKALVILPVAAILSVKEMQSDSKVNILSIKQFLFVHSLLFSTQFFSFYIYISTT